MIVGQGEGPQEVSGHESKLEPSGLLCVFLQEACGGLGLCYMK